MTATQARVVHQRWLIERDMPAVLGIESGCPGRWSNDRILTTLRERNCIGFVADDRLAGVVGWMLYELHADHLQLLRLAVHPDHRRAGVGAAMVRKLVAKLGTHRREFISALVPEWNLPFLLFLRSRGWRAVAVGGGAVAMEGRP